MTFIYNLEIIALNCLNFLCQLFPIFILSNGKNLHTPPPPPPPSPMKLGMNIFVAFTDTNRAGNGNQIQNCQSDNHNLF